MEKDIGSKDEFPFKLKASFAPAIAYWRNLSRNKNSQLSGFATNLIQELDKVPDIGSPFDDQSFIDKNKKLVSKLLSGFFPNEGDTTNAVAVTPPFIMKRLLSTKRFDDILSLDGRISTIDGYMDKATSSFNHYQKINSIILKQYYGVDNVNFSIPFIFHIPDSITGFSRYYKMQVNTSLVEIKQRHPLKKLTQDEINRAIREFKNPNVVKEIIPPENFEVEGIFIISLNNVSDHEILNNISQDLLVQGSLNRRKVFKSVRHKVRSYLGLPDIEIGLSVYNQKNSLVEDFGNAAWSRLNNKRKIKDPELKFPNSLYHISQKKELVLVEELRKEACGTDFDKALYEKGIRSLIIAPLIVDKKVIGCFEVASPHEWELNQTNVHKVQDILSILAPALKRSMDEVSNQIDAIIRNHFTSIHPSVEWKFVEAAKKFLSKKNTEKYINIDAVELDGVYPIYGQADIKNSSVVRNEAIRQDMIFNLELLLKIFKKSRLDFKAITSEMERMLTDLEQKKLVIPVDNIADIFKVTIDPFLNDLYDKMPELQEEIDHYRDKRGEDDGMISKARHDFDLSVNKINETISGFLSISEEAGQKVCRHYFEKYKTDGIEYNIYVGKDISPEVAINKKTLSALRFWQMESMCQLTWELLFLKQQLPMPLEVTQLILAYDSQLKLKFRPDEKRFDVEGSKSVRYEMIKKRIEKAVVEGTGERLTQPGTVAVVYMTNSIREEYEKHIAYLDEKGYLEKPPEFLNIEPLQGLNDIKAIRITVKQ